MRFFNTAGPVVPEDHYCVPPLTRFDLDDVLMLIAQKKYFVLHAPRQVGKTSYLLTLMAYLNQQSDYTCLYFNVEGGQAAREQVDMAMRSILGELSSRARDFLGDHFPAQITQEALVTHGGTGALNEVITQWANHSPKPLVLLIDEVDSLVGDTLISVLRQLRSGYDKRPHAFPHSIILCGVRDVRDYRIHSSSEKATITGGSAFNIKAKSLRLGDFDRAEVDTIFAQHTAETGQTFTPEALALVWELTNGQPWLVNALGYEVCFDMKPNRDRTITITADMVNTAKENIILRRETHLDQLVDKLKEPRVRRVIEPLLSGDGEPELIPSDDVAYVRDLGLIQAEGRQLNIANPIYQEVIPRELIYTTQLTISQEAVWYQEDDGRLDIAKLLTAFQAFFREHSEHWIERFDYKEAGPQLLLQAFLQRIINGGGTIHREYGLGHKRTDLLILWPYADSQVQKIVLELKILYRTTDRARERTLQDGLTQTWEYMDRAATTEGHLIIFDRTADKPWAEKIYAKTETHRDTAIQVWGM